jgi:hypothetical protein
VVILEGLAMFISSVLYCVAVLGILYGCETWPVTPREEH